MGGMQKTEMQYRAHVLRARLCCAENSEPLKRRTHCVHVFRTNTEPAIFAVQEVFGVPLRGTLTKEAPHDRRPALTTDTKQAIAAFTGAKWHVAHAALAW